VRPICLAAVIIAPWPLVEGAEDCYAAAPPLIIGLPGGGRWWVFFAVFLVVSQALVALMGASSMKAVVGYVKEMFCG
jgi:hypothetical protein